MTLRTFYIPHERVTYTGDVVDPKTGEVSHPPSMTKQSHVAECDINNILKQYSQTGQLRHISAKAQEGAYRDLPDDSDFQNALNTVLQAEKAFGTLPSKTRDRFGNDPANFLEFMADPDNQDEAIKLGLATRRAMDAPTEPQAPSPAPQPAPVPDGS